MAEKTKKPFKFNIIDVLLILLLLAIAAALIYFFFFRTATVTSTDSYSAEYVIESLEIREEFASLIKAGDKLIDTSKQRELGEVISVEYVPSTRTTVNTETGEQIEVTVPEKLDVYITVRSDDIVFDGNYKIGGSYDLFVGTYFSYRTPGFASVGNCVSMKILEK